MRGQWLDGAEDGARKTAASFALARTRGSDWWRQTTGVSRILWRLAVTLLILIIHTSGSRSINIVILLDQFSLAIHSRLQQASYIRVTRNARSTACAGLAC